ncbi:MAG: heme exporter protein CcmB [Alphaproteobacteria bacterium]|nr:heme exporter protein CcmB [Alphaproteobacteria bacterium]
MQAALALFRRDVRLYLRRPIDLLVSAMFFVLAVSLFPFGVGVAPALLAEIGVGVIWVVALLASLLAMEQIFAHDQKDGSLDVMLLSPAPLPLLVTAKILAHFVTTGLLIMVIAPILAMMLGLASPLLGLLMVSLLLGGCCLSYVGGLGAALMLGAGRHGGSTGGGTAALILLLVGPLMIPVIIFAVGLVDAPRLSIESYVPFWALLALTLAAIGGMPWAIAACLRQQY